MSGPRIAGAHDAAALSRLAARTFFDTFAHGTSPADMAEYLAAHFSEAQQRAEIEDPRTTTLVVEGGDGLIAYAQLRDNDAPDEIWQSGNRGIAESGSPVGQSGGRAIELVRFYVDRPWHGQGVARELMAACLAHARLRGARVMWLGVWEHNGRAIAFYRKHGFAVVGTHVFLVGTDAQTDNLMAVTL